MSVKRHFFLAGAAMLSCMLIFPADGAGAVSAEESARMRIIIKHPSPLEMDGAVFDHGAHLASVKKSGGGCVTCHAGLSKKPEPGQPVFRIVAAASSKEKMKDSWHAFCMDCHAKNTGTPQPAACHSCHDAGVQAAMQAPVRFDPSLHARHVGSRYIAAVQPAKGSAMLGELKNCGACHVSRLEDGSMAYVRGTEDASTFFGTDSRDPAVLSSIAHEKCVACHISVKKEGGANAAALDLPMDCASCHSSKGQSMFPVVANAPRLYRGQPDVIDMGVKESSPEKDLDPAKAVKSVPFDHKGHEAALSCMECHGPSIAKKDRDGKGGTVFASAHDPLDPASCVGCHDARAKADRGCAGCHAGMPAGGQDSCAVCHRGKADAMAGKVVHAPVPASSIPEKVTIGALSSEFEPVAFPHRKVYEVMLRGVNGNALSDAFHAQSMCMACHHHTPGENIANPPKCSACHDKSISPAQISKAPYLKTAYHQLCIGCHVAMDVKPAALDCAGCHAPVKTAADAKAKREVR